MKKTSRMEHVTRQLVTTMLSFSMVILLAGGAQAALDCTKCHGTDSVDAHPADTPAGSLAAYRNITTGAVKGNHGTHSVPTLVGNSCSRCHGPATSFYDSKHAATNNFRIQMYSSIRYIKMSSAGLNPGLKSFAQTDSPVLGSCSNANCHFEARTPQWGSDPLGPASLATCSTCHNALPITGSHTVHISEHGNDLTACVQCHSNHTVAAKPFQHATSAGRAITVFNGYTASNNLYLPSQKNDRTLGYCMTAACHDDGLGNGSASQIDSPVWGTAVVKCAVCHSRRPSTGSHFEHLSLGSASCADCHKGATEGLTVPVEHADGNIDVFKTSPGDLGFPVNKAKGSAYVSCATARCHVDPSTGGAQKISPVWGDSTQAKCSYCHASRPTTGGHQAHYNAGFAACSNCHAGAAEGATLSASHNNNLIDVNSGYPSPKAIGSAYGSCSTSSCHEDGRGNPVVSPVWGTTAANCTQCHAALPNTGSHVQHITGIGITCGQCHKGAVQGSTVPALHMNGFVDVYKVTEGDLGYPARKAKGSAFLSCSNTSCHGGVSPVWGDNTSSYQCTKCHGKGVALANFSTATYQQAAPGYGGEGFGVSRQTGTVTSNVSSDPKVGAHDTHMRSLNNMGKPVSCSDCHVVPATAFVSGHMNGDATPVWSNLAKNIETIPGSAIPYTYAKGALIPNYDSATGTCSNIYCHGATLTDGTNTAPRWNDSSYLTGNRANDCAKCHGNPPTTSTKKAHDPVTEADCASCHPHNGTRDATDALAGHDFHINGNLEAMKYCNSCHDYDTRGTKGDLWGKNAISVESFGAHAMHINYLKKRMNITTMDSNQDIYGTANFNGVCGVCHSRDSADHQQANRTTSTRNINFGDPANRAARQFGASLPQYNGITGVSSAVSPKTCSNIDCHYKTSPIWQPY